MRTIRPNKAASTRDCSRQTKAGSERTRIVVRAGTHALPVSNRWRAGSHQVQSGPRSEKAANRKPKGKSRPGRAEISIEATGARGVRVSRARGPVSSQQSLVREAPSKTIVQRTPRFYQKLCKVIPFNWIGGVF